MENIDLILLEKINEHFKHFDQEFLKKKPCRIKVEEVIEKLNNNQKLLLLDIRTEYETSLIGIKAKNTLNIPLNRLFEKDNIEKLTKFKDHEIIVICHSGARTLIATAFLHLLGFDNAKSLEGGIAAFADAVKP
ncbi:rhodanese-like domain-containing protein [Caminibacter pacificus]|jgi:rhodanese-related sulfurtransferase